MLSFKKDTNIQVSYLLRGQFTKKTKVYSVVLLTLVLFQSCMTLFILQNVKGDIFNCLINKHLLNNIYYIFNI